jgi:hypothetical protein
MVGILLLVDIRPIFDQLASRPSRSGSEPHHSHNGSVQDLLGDARDVARAVAATPEYAKACRRRKKVEMLFAHLKRILRLGRLRLRGPNGAKDEFLLAATAQNLRKLAKLIPRPAPILAT